MGELASAAVSSRRLAGLPPWSVETWTHCQAASQFFQFQSSQWSVFWASSESFRKSWFQKFRHHLSHHINSKLLDQKKPPCWFRTIYDMMPSRLSPMSQRLGSLLFAHKDRRSAFVSWWWSQWSKFWLIVAGWWWLEHDWLFFAIYWMYNNVILVVYEILVVIWIVIPIDELIFFRGVGQPPTRYFGWSLSWFFSRMICESHLSGLFTN